MWKLVAAVILVINGQPVTNPAHPPVEYNTTFPTEQACRDFIASDAGKHAVAQLKGYEIANHQGATDALVKPDCVTGGDKV